MNESPYSASQVYKEQGVGIQGGDELRASVVEFVIFQGVADGRGTS